jgi:hypothetical protein
LEQKLRKHLDKKHDVVISDVRHPKEFKLVEEYGGHVMLNVEQVLINIEQYSAENSLPSRQKCLGMW